MTLRTRVTKLELVHGGRMPTVSELQDAMALTARHFEAIVWPQIVPEFQVDPAEALLMRAAEASGQLAKAQDVEERYRRAHGYPEPDAAAVIAEIEGIFGLAPSGDRA